METYLSRDTNTNIDLKRQIAYMKAVPESYIEILDIKEDKDGEYGSINVKYSYAGEEHTVSVLRKNKHSFYSVFVFAWINFKHNFYV